MDLFGNAHNAALRRQLWRAALWAVSLLFGRKGADAATVGAFREDLVSSTPFAIIADRHGIVRKKFAAVTEEQVRVALEVLASHDGHQVWPGQVPGRKEHDAAKYAG